MPNENAERVRVVNRVRIESDGDSGPIHVDLPESKSAFGELVVAQNTPFIQNVPSYNYVPANWRQYSSGSGSSDISNREFHVSTGVTIYSYGALQSFRSIDYKAGEGGMARFTGRFATGGIADSEQGVGFLNIGDELSFGFNGVEFGVWHRHNGLAEIQTLTVTGAAGGSENATVTIDGTAYTVPLTNATVQTNANEIAAYLTANGSGINAQQCDDLVVVSFTSDGDKTGTFSFSSSTATATWVETTAGVTKTSDFVARADWNVDTADWIDPTKGNVFQVQYQYLGYGAIDFSVEDPETGAFIIVHTIKWANANTQPSLQNPALKLGIYAYSTGSTTDIDVYSGSMAAFVQGTKAKTRNPRAADNVKTGVTTALTNIMTIRNRTVVNGIINQVEADLLQFSVFTESNKGATIEIYGNATLGGTTNYQPTGTNLVMEKDTAGTTVTGGRFLAAYVIPGNSSQVIDLSTLEIRVPPTLTLTVAGKVNSGASDTIGCALVYYEDV